MKYLKKYEEYNPRVIDLTEPSSTEYGDAIARNYQENKKRAEEAKLAFDNGIPLKTPAHIVTIIDGDVYYKYHEHYLKKHGEEVDLPTEIKVDVPNDITDDSEIEEYISDKITDKTGFCHKGFSTTPKLESEK